MAETQHQNRAGEGAGNQSYQSCSDVSVHWPVPRCESLYLKPAQQSAYSHSAGRGRCFARRLCHCCSSLQQIADCRIQRNFSRSKHQNKKRGKEVREWVDSEKLG